MKKNILLIVIFFCVFTNVSLRSMGNNEQPLTFVRPNQDGDPNGKKTDTDLKEQKKRLFSGSTHKRPEKKLQTTEDYIKLLKEKERDLKQARRDAREQVMRLDEAKNSIHELVDMVMTVNDENNHIRKQLQEIKNEDEKFQTIQELNRKIRDLILVSDKIKNKNINLSNENEQVKEENEKVKDANSAFYDKNKALMKENNELKFEGSYYLIGAIQLVSLVGIVYLMFENTALKNLIRKKIWEEKQKHVGTE